ncbi:cyclin-dependent kinase-like 2 isoform X2 [Mastacembelus armatus]|uniref:cyclin-dependent kinase-like 2 isoform X2 n=1 Tax=Mastacembelus armatus TaxID=205130 RepID=UPI000E45E8A1|nr:cyclin-dependent kinase-like 2 isoform X2 [Mastacembelus armatus]
MERYETLGLVGEGSYGVVLKCRHRDSGRLVAIKKFMDSDGDKTVKKIALREIKLLRKLHHDNLVNLLEVWKRRRRWYLVFEFVERTLLDDLEQNPSGLDLNTTRQYVYQILRAAAFCHQQNIIHRDIKPENVLISQGGVVKLCDFGFARTMASPAEGGVYTDYVATRWYRAPELLVGDLKYGKPVDVWAIGCLLLEMLTGQPLFPGDSELDQIYHITRCFGDLTVHHQELFHRNPVFSEARLPERSGHVILQERYPTIPPTALDLAHSCLLMDPERRAQCSELLEHPLFTQDSFHTRFLDELNSKIQKDHRQNSTLPKITKTPRQRTDEVNEKHQRGKDKKQLQSMDEKVTKEKEKKCGKTEEKMEKTKGKQALKFSKTMGNTFETLTSLKQSQTLGTTVTDDASRASVVVKSTPEKNSRALRKEPEISKTDKTPICDSSEGTKTLTGLKESKDEPKHGGAVSPEPSENPETTNNTKGRGSSDLNSSCSDTGLSSEIKKNMMNIWECSKSEPGQEFGKKWTMKVSTLSKISATEHPNVSLSPKASLESNISETENNLTCHLCQWSDTEAAAPAVPSVSKQSKISTTSERQSSISSPKTFKVLDKEIRDDLSLSVSISPKPLMSQISKVPGSNEPKSNTRETESDGKSLKPLHSRCLIREPFSNHTKSTTTVTPKTQKEARRKHDSLERSATLTSVTDSTGTPHPRASTRSFIYHNVDVADEFDFTVLYSSPPPPPPPSSTSLLPPSSTALTTSSSVVSTNTPGVNLHLSLGTGFHPGNHSLRQTKESW